MRILFISNLYPNPLFPTMASFNRQQIQALAQHAEIEVVAPVPWTACLKKSIKPACYTADGSTVHHPVYYYTPRFFREQYGWFFYHSIKATVARLLEKNSYDIIYSSWLYPDAWAAARLAQQYQMPLFVKVHGSDVNLLQPGTVITRKSLFVVEQAQKVLCVSRALKERLIFLGAPEHKLEVVYNGVDRNIFYPMDTLSVRQQLNVLPDVFLVLFVGNLKKEKGLGELVAAFKAVTEQVEHARLVIVGSGSFKAEIEQQAAALGIVDAVTLLGTQPLKVIAQWMNAASVLCLPSYMEGVPNVVLEALACGTKVVATDVGGIPELNRHDGTMLLVPPKSSQSLFDALATMATMHDESVSGSQIVTWQENAQKLYTMFKEHS